MKRTKLLILSLLMSVGLVVGVASATEAKWSDSLQGQDNVTVAAGQTHQGSLYAAGDQIVVEGTINGDLYCGGREVIIKGEVTGDVICGVQTMTIDGDVGQDVRVAGQYVSLNGDVAGSLTFFGQDLKILANGSVGGDINGGGQFITLGGPVDGNVVVGVERLTLQSRVGGDINAGVTNIAQMNDSSVAGDLNYSADSEINIDASQVAGEVSYNPAQQGSAQGSSLGMMTVVFMLSLLICSLIVVSVAPRFVDRARAAASRRFVIVALVGFAVLFGAPVLAGLAMFTLVLLPIGLLLLTLWFGAMLLSHALFAYWLGSLAFASQSNVLLRTVAGVAILFVLYLIPLINALVGFVALVIGMGMVVVTVFDGYKRPNYSLAVPKKVKAKSKK